MIPSQLSGLQVGFEIDDGLYEVHSLTKGRGGVKRLLQLPNVGFGITTHDGNDRSSPFNFRTNL